MRPALLNGWKRFGRDTRGVAAVEFALILPLLLLLYLGSVEATQLYATDRRVLTIANTVADLVARSKATVKGSNLQDYFEAATNVLKPGQTANLTQIVSLVSIDAAGVAKVVWSASRPAGKARAAGSSFPLDPASQVSKLARGAKSLLVVGEASFPYVPLTGFVFASTINLSHTGYFLPRRENTIDYDPSV